MTKRTADHDAVGTGRLGRFKNRIGKLNHNTRTGKGKVGAAALQAMGPGYRLGADRLDYLLHDGGRFDTVQVGYIGRTGQQTAVVAGNLQARQRLVHSGSQALQTQVAGEDFEQMFDLAINFQRRVKGLLHLFALDGILFKDVLGELEP